jgi:PAS domain S-box-containing protein
LVADDADKMPWQQFAFQHYLDIRPRTGGNRAMRPLSASMLSQRLTLGVGLAVLLAIGAASVAMDVKSRDDAALVDHTLTVLNKVTDMRLQVRKAESASRGFALSGDEGFAREFHETAAKIPAALAELKAAVGDNPAQRELLESIEPTLTRRLAVSAEMLRLRAAQDSEGITALIAKGEGRAAMAKIGLDLDRFTAEEQRLLTVRSAQSRSSRQWLLSIDLVGIVLILILGGLLMRGAHLSTRILTSSLSATKAANESLEAQVAVRDEHLDTAQSVMESTFNSMTDAVLVLDTKGGIMLSNPAAQHLLGYREGMTLGDLWLVNNFCQPDGVTQLSAEERPSTIVLAGKPIERKEVVIRPVDGRKPLHVIVSGRPLCDAGGDIRGGAIVFHDITEAQETERKLQQAQKLDAIGQLTGGVAHDFNNMLTVITGTMEVVMDELKDNPEALQIAALVDQAADRCTDLIQHLLSFARKQPLRPRNVDVNSTILDIAKLLRPTLGEQIEIDSILEHEVATAHIDASQLANSLVNMAINARDAMPDGGKLLLETRNVVLDEAYAQANLDVTPGLYVMLAVTDTGTGMPAAIRDRVFEPFFTTKGESGRGSGLGLSMVYGFVKQSGGHIKIYSEEGHGTTIRLYLPPALAKEAVPAAPVAIPSGHETILVVEDDKLVRDFVVAQLKSLGYTTITAANGREALSHVEAGAAFDLLFTDVIMPSGINGRELADEVERLRPGTRVLYTSGYTDTAIVHHGRLDQGVLLLSKPYRKSGLANMVRVALGDATEADANTAAAN